MKQSVWCLLWAGAVCAAVGAETLPNFRLLDTAGVSHEVYRNSHETAAVLLYVFAPGCGHFSEDITKLEALRAAVPPDQLQILLINAAAAKKLNPFAAMDLARREFTVLEDRFQLVARALEMQQTGAVLAETKHWEVLYRGPLADGVLSERFGVRLGEEFEACALPLDPLPEAVSYARDVAPVLERRCVPCHRRGGIGPFALSSHAKVRGWSAMIKEVLLTQRMPPWFADSRHGSFANDRSLPREELDTLLGWIDSGAPEDDSGGDPLAATAAAPAPEWALGPPDLVIELPSEQHIPAQGVFDYVYVEVPSGLTEDKWVRAVDLQASNRTVTHHAVAFVNYPSSYTGERFDDEGGLNGYFALYVPGADPMAFPPGTGKLVPAGSSFVFSLHYTATGKPETDRTRMGLYFHATKPEQELFTRSAANQELNIPPNTADSPVTAMRVLDRDVTLWSLSPHMHYRGKRVRYEAEYPDGRREVLLSVPDYHFDWQLLYQLKEPKHLPRGTRIHVEGAFDNSAANPYNPDPNAWVGFGSQSFEEMFIAYLNYSCPVAEAE